MLQVPGGSVPSLLGGTLKKKRAQESVCVPAVRAAVEELALEVCGICLEPARCAHVKPHGSLGQRCGGFALCLTCCQGVAQHSTPSRQSYGQFRCPICRSNLGTLRRALAERSAFYMSR
mmetsp:Transcript_91863/g.263094  ORF Transcript_91863/g.263094 Transcript_91863/m.263094 type:complete len:119 (+) Transcript_91863:273-629(+)